MKSCSPSSVCCVLNLRYAPIPVAMVSMRMVNEPTLSSVQPARLLSIGSALRLERERNSCLEMMKHLEVLGWKASKRD